MEPNLTRDPVSQPDRIDTVLTAWSGVLPTRILARILNLGVLAINRRKAKLSLPTSLVEGKRITSQFLRTLPDLTAPGLTDEERTEIRVLRLEWIAARQQDKLENERASEIVAFCSLILPTAALARVADISPERVIREQEERGIELDRSRRRTIEQRFDSARSCPLVHFLNGRERKKLEELWKSRHARYLDNAARRFARSMESAKTLLGVLDAECASLRRSEAPPPESRCSGPCEREWPRTKVFFISNWRRDDKLGDRCKYCTAVSRAEARYQKVQKSALPRLRKRGRILSAEERPHCVEVIQAYSLLLPPVLLRTLFRIGNETLARLRHESGVSLNTKNSRRILWRWYFRPRPPDLPLLTTMELARLYLLETKLRELIRRRYEPNEEHRQLLNTEATRLKTQSATPVREFSCKECKLCYPRTRFFFKTSGRKLRRKCKVCANFHAARARLAALRRKFG